MGVWEYGSTKNRASDSSYAHILIPPYSHTQKIRLAVRVGIHTGLVVVGEMGEGDKHEQLALGGTPNIAARVQGIAEPDTVVISSVTYRLIEGFFVCQDLGSHPLKGLSQPMEVYQVLQESGVQSRLEAAVTTGLTPLVGREQEVGLLLECWQRVKKGMGQVVLLSGEPGIGKSRLVKVLKKHLSSEPHSQSECRCSSYLPEQCPVSHHRSASAGLAVLEGRLPRGEAG